MAGFIEGAVLFLHSLGVFTVILPFILIYVISYGLMLRVKMFQREGSNDYMKYNSILAFCLAFFTISAVDLTERLPMFIALVSFLFIGLLIINILLGMLGGTDVLHSGKGRFVYLSFVGLYLLFAVIEVFFDWAKIVRFIGKSGASALLPVIIFLLIFLGIVYWVTRESNSSSEKSSSPKESNSDSNSSKSSGKHGPKPLSKLDDDGVTTRDFQRFDPSKPINGDYDRTEF